MNAPVIPEKRKPLTRRQRVDLYDDHKGKCCICLLPIPTGDPWIDEHVIPLELGGSNDLSNRGPAHVDCARKKTARDQRAIAKSYRTRARHLGVKKPRTITRWRKFDGTPVYASRERE